MKTVFALITMLILVPAAVSAQNKKYESMMQREIKSMDQLKSEQEWVDASSQFATISNENASEWLPSYYQGYTLLKAGMSTNENSKADEYFDKALSALDKSEAISKSNSEISTLRSWILSMKISIDPVSRAYELGMQANTLLSAAIIQDASNPRPYLLQGLAALYTPEEYGGSKKKAAELLKSSIEKFETFKPTSSLMPVWGLEKAKSALEACNN